MITNAFSSSCVSSSLAMTSCLTHAVSSFCVFLKIAGAVVLAAESAGIGVPASAIALCPIRQCKCQRFSAEATAGGRRGGGSGHGRLHTAGRQTCLTYLHVLVFTKTPSCTRRHPVFCLTRFSHRFQPTQVSPNVVRCLALLRLLERGKGDGGVGVDWDEEVVVSTSCSSS